MLHFHLDLFKEDDAADETEKKEIFLALMLLWSTFLLDLMSIKYQISFQYNFIAMRE